MASLIKNQIVKHLSRFAKNLSPDQISLEVLRGKGELHNVRLNEAVIGELLELPKWVKIEEAVCSRVAVKIPWTKLKSSPVQMFVDEISVKLCLTSEKMEAQKKDDTWTKSASSLLSSYTPDINTYGFAHKVVEGISLYVNMIEVQFSSDGFGGSLLLSRLAVESRTPAWNIPRDLRETRIRDPDSDQQLMFKHVAWQLLRIEAYAMGQSTSAQPGETTPRHLAPIRLITSDGKCRIAIRKSTNGRRKKSWRHSLSQRCKRAKSKSPNPPRSRMKSDDISRVDGHKMRGKKSKSSSRLFVDEDGGLSEGRQEEGQGDDRNKPDGRVSAARLQLVLDEILWVATLPQVRSAIAFYKQIIKLIEMASSKQETVAKKKINVSVPNMNQKPVKKHRTAKKVLSYPALSSMFSTLASGGGSSPRLSQRQVASANNPSHSASQPRLAGTVVNPFKQFDIRETSYHFYVGKFDLHFTDENTEASKKSMPDDWDIVSGALQCTMHKFGCDIYPYHQIGVDREHWVRYKGFTAFESFVNQLTEIYKQFKRASVAEHEGIEQSNVHSLNAAMGRLMAQCIVLRIEELVVHSLTDITTTKQTAGKVLNADRNSEATVPANVSMVHAELTNFYYPSGFEWLPVPPPVSHVVVSPVQVNLDYPTARWLNYIYQDVFKTLDLDTAAASEAPVDASPIQPVIRVEATMPKLIIHNPITGNDPSSTDRHLRRHTLYPERLVIRTTSLLLTNSLIGDQMDAERLPKFVTKMKEYSDFRNEQVVNSSQLPCLPTDAAVFHSYCLSLKQLQLLRSSNKVRAEKDEPWLAQQGVLCARLQPLWLEFDGDSLEYTVASPFVIDVPLTVWVVENAALSLVHLMIDIHTTSSVRVRLNHFEYLSLIRIIERVQAMTDLVEADNKVFSKCSNGAAATPSFVACCALEQVDLNLVIPTTAAPHSFDLLLQKGVAQLSGNADGEASPSTLSSTPLSPSPVCDRRDTITGPHPDIAPPLVIGESPPKQTVDAFPTFPNFKQDDDSESVLAADDTMSIGTDLSDDERFIVLETEGAPFDDVFCDNAVEDVDEAVEATEERDTVNRQRHLDAVMQRKTNAIHLALKGVCFLAAGSAGHAASRLTSNSLTLKQIEDVTMAELLHSIRLVPSPRHEPPPSAWAPEHERQLQIRVFRDPAQPIGELAVAVTHANFHLANHNLANLIAFIEDNQPPNPVGPLAARLTNVGISIQDTLHKHVPPTALVLSDSVVNIGRAPTAPFLRHILDSNKPAVPIAINNGVTTASDRQQIKQLQEQNDSLRKQLAESNALLVKLASLNKKNATAETLN